MATRSKAMPSRLTLKVKPLDIPMATRDIPGREALSKVSTPTGRDINSRRRLHLRSSIRRPKGSIPRSKGSMLLPVLRLRRFGKADARVDLLRLRRLNRLRQLWDRGQELMTTCHLER